MPSWIDYKELRAKLDFEQVLTHFGVPVKRKGEQHLGFCPLPAHEGKRNSPSFSANLDRGIFHCFGCHGRGNVLDFAVLMNGESPEDGRALKKAALALRAHFFPEYATRGPAKEATPPERETVSSSQQMELETVVNPPLDFELKDLDGSHPYLAGRGFQSSTTQHFGVGYCGRGLLAERIAIPLHDRAGHLIGYAGRVVDDTAINAENPRYRFPSKRERDGKMIEFKKTQFLYNGHRVKKPRDDLGVVEGFASVWWLHQNGLPCVVATMGAECSDEQAGLIVSLVKPRGRIWIVPDGDKAGERFALSLLTKLAPHRFIHWLKLNLGEQPTDLTPEFLKRTFLS